MKRIFAHNLIFGGRHYPCHVFEYDEASGRTALYPFSGEIHSTRFFPGSVEVTLADGDVVAGPPDIPVMLFEPYTKTTMWGGTRISGLKGSLHATVEKVGESWEVSAMPGKESRVAGGPLDGHTVASLTERYGPALLGFGVYGRHGAEFPLLVKFLDAADNLSLQVHPSDSMAARRNAGHGKDEMWYVVDASPGARVFTGFSSPMTPGAFVSAVSGGNIMDAVSSRLSRPGDSFFIPAGTVHCLGAGNLVLEIQGIGQLAEKYLRMRHKMIPFLYSASCETSEKGLPLIEPMYYEYPEESDAYVCEGQYLFGRQLLVAPITEKSSDFTGFVIKKVWLPEGKWTDFFTGDEYEGGEWKNMVRPLDYLPVLVRD